MNVFAEYDNRKTGSESWIDDINLAEKTMNTSLS